MKQLTCEMCGGTDLLKQDGVFVCQTCGCKYSVEEARKMMGEVSSTPVEVKNAAQLENLLNLAKSSFQSKNYAQAENFCNQVIAMDDKNYEAWKLKGEAINFQINSTNQRILEVYNCIMTSYRILSDEEKEVKKYEIIASLKMCFEGEVEFWLGRFEADRPTDAALARVKESYKDSYNKMKTAFEELGLENLKEGYLINFDNFFVGKCNAICNAAWKSTVGYNYYREYFGKLKDPFGRTNRRWIVKGSNLYRPTKKIWDTFLSETDNLINLLQFAEKHFNDDTNPKVMEAIYGNIAYFEECVIPSGSWKVTTGYASRLDSLDQNTLPSVGWIEEYALSEAAKKSRKEKADDYRKKEATMPQIAEARQKAKREEERKKRIAEYWEKHAEEKAKLDQEQDELAKQMDTLKTQISAIEQKNDARLGQLREERDKQLLCEVAVDKQRAVIHNLEEEKHKCGIFKGKEKKAIQARLDNEEKPKLESLEKIANDEKLIHQQKVDAQIAAIQEEGKELREEVAKLKKRSDEITAELTKDRK